MRNIILLTSLLFLLSGCHKKNKELPVPVPAHPQMHYADLGNTPVPFGGHVALDPDEDGQIDIWFSTLLVGDPLAQVDKMQWLLSTSFDASLPIKNESIPILALGDTIPVQNFSGYAWYNASTIVLAQKIIRFTSNPYWEGEWKTAVHQYVPFFVLRQNQRYNGWVEISFDSADETIILHKAAICTEAGKAIVAGK